MRLILKPDLITVGSFRCVLDSTMSRKSLAVGTGAICLSWPRCVVMVGNDGVRVRGRGQESLSRRARGREVFDLDVGPAE